ncbi:MAG: septum formation initiator family protein [Actinobacteria bacterium]|nr:septum formation initiator family protein [Actinomycetota bacterium]
MSASSLRHRLGLGPQIVALVLALGLAAAMAVEPTRRLIDQRNVISGMESDLQTLNATNRWLEDRVRRLNDRDYLEQQARELGLALPGETTYVVVPKKRDAQGAHKRRDNGARPLQEARPGEKSFLERALHFIGIG